jgi:DNA-binding transcriptional regulator YhcF (GntR family)
VTRPNFVDIQIVHASLRIGCRTPREIEGDTGIPLVIVSRALAVLESRRAVRWDRELGRHVAVAGVWSVRLRAPQVVVRAGW